MIHTSKREVCAQLFDPKNASKFAIFMEKENPRSFFRLSFQAFLSFYFMNALVDIDHGIYKVKLKVARNEKQKKNYVSLLFL